LADARARAESLDGGNVYVVGDGEGDPTFGDTDVPTGTVVTFVRDACGSVLLTGNEQCDDGERRWRRRRARREYGRPARRRT
jgi:hypothetical protein